MQFLKNHPRISFLIFVLLFSHLASFSQCAISGKIVDSTKTPIPFVTLALLNNADSSVYKGAITDDNGKFCFNDIKSGTYLLKISAVGFAVKIGSPMQYDSSSSVVVPDIVIHSQAKNLKEVSVMAIKDPIEFKNGNVIVNIEGSPLAVGNSAYDLLSHLPGVTVENDKITLEGNSGVQIFIDDRMQQMSGQQLINLLRSINSSAIEKIEILKNPPVKYDASGTAGIINIKTKKLKITGFSGNVNYTYSQGLDMFHYAGVSLNYKWKKVAVFSGVNFSGGRLRFEDDFDKSVTYNSTTTILNQKSVTYDNSAIPVYNLGMDWYVNKKNTIGIKLQGESAEAVRSKPGNTFISDNSLGYHQLGFNRAVTNNWNYFNGNFNLEHLFDTSGTSLKFSTDYYGPTIDYYKGIYENHFYDNNGTETLPPLEFKGDNTVDLRILASKLDFEKKLSKTLNLEAGVKESYQKITSDYVLQDKNNQTGDYTTDSTFTNKFSYEERITAGYFNLQKEIKKVNLQFGLRAENTAVHTESITKSFKYDKQYFNLFPVISVDYKQSERSVFQLSYNNRINRPNYEAFNPYKAFENILTSNMGNPYLLPTISNTINLTHTYKGKISNSFSYRRVTNPFINYASQNDSTKESIFHDGNLKNSNIIGYTLFVRTNVYKWWSLTFNGVAYYLDYTGQINGFDYSASAFSYRGYVNNQIILPKNVKIELSANYNGPRLEEMYHYTSRWWVNIAIKKSLLKDKLNLTIGLQDIFKTSGMRITVNFQDQNWKNYQYYDARRLTLGISYNFGNIKVEQREVNAADTEQERRGK